MRVPDSLGKYPGDQQIEQTQIKSEFDINVMTTINMKNA